MTKIASPRELDDPTAAEHLRRTQPRIEQLLGILAVRYGARESRYFGRQKPGCKSPGLPHRSA